MAKRQLPIPKLNGNGNGVPQVAPNGKGLHARVKYEMTTGDPKTVTPRVQGVLDQALPRKRGGIGGSNMESAQIGEIKSHKPPHTGRTLMNEIRSILKERCKISKLDGRSVEGDRFHAAAEAVVKKMEAGEFPFFKEFVEREEGKVPVRVADADGQNIKIYQGMPVDGPNAP